MIWFISGYCKFLPGSKIFHEMYYYLESWMFRIYINWINGYFNIYTHTHTHANYSLDYHQNYHSWKIIIIINSQKIFISNFNDKTFIIENKTEIKLTIQNLLPKPKAKFHHHHLIIHPFINPVHNHHSFSKKKNI